MFTSTGSNLQHPARISASITEEQGPFVIQEMFASEDLTVKSKISLNERKGEDLYITSEL